MPSSSKEETPNPTLYLRAETDSTCLTSDDDFDFQEIEDLR